MKTLVPSEKTAGGAIQAIFSEVHGRYELVNHLLTFGLDTAWRKIAARTASRASGGGFWVDVCTGTGELAVCLGRLAPEGTRIAAVDFSVEMMAEAMKKREAGRIGFLAARAGKLPFRDGSVDLVTMAFATRNINISREVLSGTFAEYNRILRPGGCFVNLETSQPSSLLMRKCYHVYVKLIVSTLGSLISGTRAGYSYLARSIPLFYDPTALAGIIREAGFHEVRYGRLCFGAVAVHQAWKKPG